ncbi:zinc ribbon domain-containing protein [Picosynechococcus sp. NKBG042902]|uniref:zinc ribbon domain-containing protein n=1 Tax=Picosynechococcus sp. NKBG042902 TaxID=490193 RepID=UPI0004AA7B8E|nr:zinc ribbon domain-containing protein [Picosynechococcus sp. NKBG042902]
MVRWLKRLWRNLVRKSTHVRQEPLNKVSIVILILIDIFVLINVFQGLDSVGNWPLSPQERYPCYRVYQTYQNNDNSDKDFTWVMEMLGDYPSQDIQPVETEGRLGEVSSQCDRLLALTPTVKNPETLTLSKEIQNLQTQINEVNQRIATYKEQYDSTLLEEIAGQDPNQSINETTAAQTKADIEAAEAQKATLTETLDRRKAELLNQSEVQTYLTAIGDRQFFATLKQDFERAEFWHPNRQFFLQTLFLLPLILISYFWHRQAVERHRGTQALLSWHLLLIFLIPLLIKILQFIQFGNLVRAIFDVLIAIFGGLVFISSYLLILIIPLLGFGLIKFLQRFVFNPKVQAKSRIQKQRCIQCSSRLRKGDQFCPFCGFEQWISCPNCAAKTYKYTEYCRQCGVDLSDSLPQ